MTICPTTGRKNRAGCHELRENAIVSSEHAASDEKTKSSCQGVHRPTRKRNLLAGACLLRRETEIVSPEHGFAVEKKSSSAQPDRELKTCTHREFNSDYRGD